MKREFDFMGARRWMAALSLLLLVVSAASLGWRQLNFGLDFSGGTLLEVGYERPADLDAIRSRLAGGGYDRALVVHFGSQRDVLLRMPGRVEDTLGAELLNFLRQGGDEVALRRIEFVGPQVGEELREQGGLALLAALALVLLYVAFRFQLKFAIGAVLALFHDVLITLGVFSVLQWEFDLTVLAALLAVIGYSLNDSIVVADRIRENFRATKQGEPQRLINISLNQTLGRTLITSLTTLLVLTALLLAGGEQIRGFASALTIGVIIGTYSSIYVVGNVLMALKISTEDLQLPTKEQGNVV